MKKVLSVVLFISIMVGIVSPVNASASQKKLTKSQGRNADRIAEIVSSKWEKYGVLPSVCIAQAFVESTLGDHCRGYNLWGINSGEGYNYSSLEEGTNAYLKVIRDSGYYDDAPFVKSPRKQLYRILYDEYTDSDGDYHRVDVYCEPAGDYLKHAMYAIEKYNLEKYDRKMFKDIEKKKQEKKRKKLEKIQKRKEKEQREREAKEKEAREWREKEQEGFYVVVHDGNIPNHSAMVDENIFPKGTISIIYRYELQGIYDVQSGEQGKTIRINNPELDGKIVKVDACEEAVG